MTVPSLDLSWFQIAWLLVTALVAGTARGFSGFGAALIFMPVASAVVGPRVAAPLLLIVDTVMAFGLIPDAWRRAERPSVGIMAIGALVGVPLGTSALTWFDALTIRWGIVLLVILLLALLVSGWRYRGRPAPWLTIGVGGLAGFCSGAAQVGGPPVVAYWLGGAIPSGMVRANVVLYFAVSSALTMVSYAAGHLITLPILVVAVTVGPAYGAGLLAGARLFGRASEAGFRLICFGLIALAAILGLPVLDGLLR